jgi:hypothetical protein
MCIRKMTGVFSAVLCLGTQALAQSSVLPLEIAEQRCGERVGHYAATPRGRFGNYPDDWKTRTSYRACVFGYTKKYPVNYPEFGPEKLFDLDAFIHKQRGLS